MILRRLCALLAALWLTSSPALAQPQAESDEIDVPVGPTFIQTQFGVDDPAEDPSVDDSSVEQRLRSLLVDLTSANLSGSLAILEELETLGGARILPLMENLQEGALYYIESSSQVISFEPAGPDTVLAYDILSGEELGDLPEADLGRIRVNNRLRAFVRDATARINLLDGDVRQREAAATELISSLSNLTADNAELMRQAMETEENNAVRTTLSIGLAMHTLRSEAPRAERVEAARQLDGILEGAVRNLLRNLLDENFLNESDPEVREVIAASLLSIERKINFYGWIEELFYGLSLGSVLLLAAIGLAVTFGVMGVINMAHGEMLMLGAYTTYVVQLLMPQFINHSIWVAIPSAFLVSGMVGILIQRYVIRYLNGRPLETLLATFGISLILQQAVRTIFSPMNRRVVSPEWMSGSWDLNPVLSLTYNRLYILVFALIIFMVLLFILKKTSLGLQVRAVSQNRDMARAMGIRTDRVDAMTFGLGSGIAGIAGVALSQLTNVGPNLGQAYIIDSFMVVVFGGVGNLLGTLVGAFTLGIGTKFMEPFTGAILAKILILVFIILFIQIRPQGLFPHKGRAAE